ncbi:hypothetical protein PM082_023320 [Marasmius tenuissimus]|nr:hypothetical protein PM082_023320 [Marasmius tenuissimus]
MTSLGYNGVSIWELETGNLVPVPPKFAGTEDARYMPSVAIWVYFEDMRKHVVVLGGIKGDLCAWTMHDPKKGFEHLKRALTTHAREQILSICAQEPSVSAPHARIAVSCADASVSVWKLSSIGEFTKVFCITMDINFLPKSVRFDTLKNVCVFDINFRLVTVLHKKDGHTLKSTTTTHRMSSVALDLERDRLIVHTGKDIQLLSFSKLKCEKTYKPSAPLTVNFPKQLAFIEDRTQFVSGSDSGHAAIYSVEKGDAIVEQILEYPNGGLVQTVAASSGKRWNYVALAGTTAGRSCDVLLFRKKRPSSFKPKLPDWLSLKPQTLVSISIVAMVMLLGYFYRTSVTMWFRYTPDLPSSVTNGHHHQARATWDSMSNPGTKDPTLLTPMPPVDYHHRDPRHAFDDTSISGSNSMSSDPRRASGPFAHEYDDIIRKLQARLNTIEERRGLREEKEHRNSWDTNRPQNQYYSRRQGWNSRDIHELEGTHTDAFYSPGDQVWEPRSGRPGEFDPYRESTYRRGLGVDDLPREFPEAEAVYRRDRRASNLHEAYPPPVGDQTWDACSTRAERLEPEPLPRIDDTHRNLYDSGGELSDGEAEHAGDVDGGLGSFQLGDASPRASAAPKSDSDGVYPHDHRRSPPAYRDSDVHSDRARAWEPRPTQNSNRNFNGKGGSRHSSETGSIRDGATSPVDKESPHKHDVDMTVER